MNRSSIILVIDHNEDLISKLNGYALVVYMSDLLDIYRVQNSIQPLSKIHCVVYDNPYCSLSSLDFNSNWKGIPIHLFISAIGDFSKLVPLLPVLRDLDIRIFFYATSPSAFVDAQILSSLGIHSGVILTENQSYWEELNDLIHYSIYGKMLHAPIEPFGFLCQNYNQNETCTIKNVYFNSPDRYLHLNEKEEIALSREDLLAGNFIEQGIEHLDLIKQNTQFSNNLIKWQQLFLKEDGCAFCSAWRICGGFFENQNNTTNCRETFSELLEAVEFYNNSNKSINRSELCQL